MSVLAHFFVVVCGSLFHERLAHFFVDIYSVIYCLIETTKENDLDPYRYLVWLLHNAPEQSQKDEDWPEFFLPVNAPKECRS